jgi:hypothetical protein
MKTYVDINVFGVTSTVETTRAFSSEVDTGSPATNAKRLRGENASKQESRAPFRFYRNGNGSSQRHPDKRFRFHVTLVLFAPSRGNRSGFSSSCLDEGRMVMPLDGHSLRKRFGQVGDRFRLPQQINSF